MAKGHFPWRQTAIRTGKLAPAKRMVSGLRLGFTQSGDTVAIFPLAALFEKLGAFKLLKNIAFTAQGGSGAQAAML